VTTDMAVRGVDVSSHQGYVNWTEVAASGITFGFTKCTGGAWYRNDTFAANWDGMRAAGLVRGAYAYAFESTGQPYPGPGPEAEADFFLESILALGLAEGDMLALDIEEGPDGADLADWALRWLVRVEQRVGFRPLLYSGAWFTDARGFGRVPALAAYPLWQAAYSESQPSPAAPWPMIAFWQQTDKASVPGIAMPCDLNVLTEQAGSLALYGKPSGLETVVPPLVVAQGPHYDATYHAIAQNDDWSCAPTSTRWALWAYGRQPSEAWLESSMLNAGVVTTEYGLSDASGAQLARWITSEYGEFGYHGENDPSATFDEVAQEAAQGRHPLCMGGRAWYHWTGVRGFADGVILLANPAPGWKGISQTMTRQQFEYLGPFSMVRLAHESESIVVPQPPQTGPSDPLAPYRGGIGSGILSAMEADGVVPAQRASTWLPLGARPSDVETCYASDGTLYTYLLTEGRGFKTPPS